MSSYMLDPFFLDFFSFSLMLRQVSISAGGSWSILSLVQGRTLLTGTQIGLGSVHETTQAN